MADAGSEPDTGEEVFGALTAALEREARLQDAIRSHLLATAAAAGLSDGAGMALPSSQVTDAWVAALAAHSELLAGVLGGGAPSAAPDGAAAGTAGADATSVAAAAPLEGLAQHLARRGKGGGVDLDAAAEDAYARAAQAAFSQHCNPYKGDFYKKYRIDFVMGARRGPVLEDVRGRADTALYNLHCNGGVFNWGHRNPTFVAALVAGMRHLDIGNHHLVSVERGRLASLLASLMPGDVSKVVFSPSGSEANDLAIKIARGYTGTSTACARRASPRDTPLTHRSTFLPSSGLLWCASGGYDMFYRPFKDNHRRRRISRHVRADIYDGRSRVSRPVHPQRPRPARVGAGGVWRRGRIGAGDG